MKSLLFALVVALLISSTLTTSKTSKKDSNDQQNSKAMRKSLFDRYSDLIVETKLLSQNQILSERNTSVILEDNYLEMYKNRLKFKIPVKFSDGVKNVKDIKLNITYYISIDDKYRKIFESQEDLIKFYQHSRREGIENFLLTETDSLGQQSHSEPYISSNFHIYLFMMSEELQLQNPESQLFGLFQDYYFPYPLTGRFSSLKEDRIPLENAMEEDTHWIYLQLKVRNSFFSMFFYGVQLALHDLTVEFQTQGSSEQEKISALEIQRQLDSYFDLMENLDIEQYFVRFLRNVFFDGTFLSTALIIIEVFISFLSPISGFITMILFYKRFKNAQSFRGISMYSSLALLWLVLLDTVANPFIKDTSQRSYDVFVIVFGFWTLGKIGTFQQADSFPFVSLRTEAWYNPYRSKDWQAFKKISIGAACLLVACMVFPLLREQGEGADYLERNMLMIKQFARTYYVSCFMLVQILLNREIKCANGMSTLLLFWLWIYYSPQLFFIHLSNSYFEILFHLKQLLLVSILLAQKYLYGNKMSREFQFFEEMEFEVEQSQRIHQDMQRKSKQNGELDEEMGERKADIEQKQKDS